MISCVAIHLSFNNQKKKVLLYTDIPSTELEQTIRAAFNLDLPKAQVVGFQDPITGIHYPMSMITSSPQDYTTQVFELVLYAPDPSVLPPGNRKTSLGNFTLRQLMEIFTSAAPSGALDRTTFEKCVQQLCPSQESSMQKLKQSLHVIYDIFDPQRQHVVDSRDFLAGLSLLTTGNRQEKIQASFDLCDVNKDNYISLGEMTQYLWAVFAVMQKIAPQVFQHYKVDPQELADITAQQCFQDAGLSFEENLSFDEFQQWYNVPIYGHIDPAQIELQRQTQVPEDTKPPLSLEEIRRISGLGQFSAEDMFALFSQNAPLGELSRDDFQQCFREVLRSQNRQVDAQTATLIDRLFEIFDADGNDTVTFNELASGLSVLCGGSREDKVAAAFSLFDINEDGFISKEEMTTYLTSVFKVMYETTSSTEPLLQLSPEQLATVTVEEAFREADKNGDGKLNFEEFQEWYTSAHATDASPSVAFVDSAQKNSKKGIPLSTVRRLTTLESRTPVEVFAFFAEGVNDDGLLTRDAFNACFAKVIGDVATLMNEEEMAMAKKIIDNLFDIFDADGDQYVDFVELSSGLSILCGGNQKDKVASAFSLFDIDGDGFISPEELQLYLTSVFRILYATNPELHEQTGVDLNTLARATTEQAFRDCDRNQDGRLNLEEFRHWYSNVSFDRDAQANQDEKDILTEAAPTVDVRPETLEAIADSLHEARRLTNLQSYDVKDIFAFFQASTGASNALSKEQFFRCFNKLIVKTGGHTREDQIRARELLDELFSLFDTDDNGEIDLLELGAGLSILCGGSADEKARAAFNLYDTNGDGFLSRKELEHYLRSMFRILQKTSAISHQAIGVSPEHLAAVTVQKCFEACDVNRDGQLSFDEFRSWFKDPYQRREQVDKRLSLSLAALREATGFDSLELQQVADVFGRVSRNGRMTISTFGQGFRRLLALARDSSSSQLPFDVARTISELFSIYDPSSEGFVQVNQIVAGFSILCNGSRDTKVEQAFNYYDTNNDGYLSLDEMTDYLTAVFVLLYAAEKQFSPTQFPITPQELAVLTAEEAFKECDVNQDGQLDLKEFQRWYKTTSAVSTSAGNEQSPPTLVELDLDRLRRLTNLKEWTTEQVMDLFTTFSMDEYGDAKPTISREQFTSCFQFLVRSVYSTFSSAERREYDELIIALFDAFDVDQNGLLDRNELLSGLSILCQGSGEDKIRAAFQLYDTNKDNYISMDEMVQYLRSVFQLLYQFQPQVQTQLGSSVEDLAIATAAEIFQIADTNLDGQLSFQEFKTWYRDCMTKDASSSSPPVSASAQCLSTSFEQLRRLTKLDQFSAEELFELFAEYANEDGEVTRSVFNQCFQHILRTARPDELSPRDRHETKEIITRLFTLFDPTNQQSIDFSELASGLTVLCGGSHEEKVEAAFSLFDFNCDGYISLNEMIKYLSSVFRVLYAISSDSNTCQMKNTGMTPEALARCTATEAFQEADRDEDGKLSLDEFKAWYQRSHTSPSKETPRAAVSPRTLNSSKLAEIRRLTNLESYSTQEVFETLAEYADEDGFISRDPFFECFQNFVNAADKSLTMTERLEVRDLLERLFNLFDRDLNGKVDFSELSSGISILCGGSRDDRVKAAFALFDFNGDGFISLEEMTRYLVSVFRVLNETNPGQLQRLQTTPEALGKITAEQAFDEADTNDDGLLTLEEFQSWYTDTTATALEQVFTQAIPENMSLEEIKHLTNLGAQSVGDVFEVFATAVDANGMLDRKSFYECFRKLINTNPSSRRSASNASIDLDRVRVVIDRLFSIFDTDGSGLIDFSELASGLSVLCGGSRDEKVRAAFCLYDFNQDGYISKDEMTRYLTSVFRILYEASSDTRTRMGVGPEDLGRITAEQAFAEADLDQDGRLSYEEFRQWYTEPNQAFQQAPVTPEVPESVSLDLIREMTHLDQHNPSSVFQVFASHCDEDGKLSREMFDDCFDALIDNRDQQDPVRVKVVLDTLFRIFDKDNNGIVDFSELSSGVSVLCGGNRESKIEAAFSLYDGDGDGYISIEEMSRYLNSVFRVLYETTPSTFGHLNVSPQDLANITAEQCFADAELNEEGLLSYDEFVKWYSKDGLKFDMNAATEKKLAQQAQVTASSKDSGMDRIRKLLKLDVFDVQDVFEIFGEGAPNGELTFAAFKRCFDHIANLSGGHDSEAEQQQADALIRRLFNVFDANGNSTVDFGELASGLSVLSGSSLDEKILAAFQLYDVNNDGFITLDEMVSYMSSIFKVMYETSDETRKMGVGPEQLAAVTAKQCFEDADLNHDGKLNFNEFKKWCTSSMR